MKAKYANDESEFMEVKGLNVHFRDEGPSSDTIPLILLHGTSSSLMTWDETTAMLKSDRRVIRLDLPAFALTGPNKQNDYSLEYYVAFVREFLNKLKIDKCILIGNSLGGAITWHYALAYPDQVHKMVLIDAAGYPIDFSKGSLAFTLAKIPLVKNILKYVTPRSIVEKSLKDVYGDKTKVTEELIDLYHDMSLREGNRAALIARFSKPFADKHQFITTIQTPTLIIWGALDQLIPLKYGIQFDQDLPNSELATIGDVGHVPMEEVPEIVAPLIQEFISKPE